MSSTDAGVTIGKMCYTDTNYKSKYSHFSHSATSFRVEAGYIEADRDLSNHFDTSVVQQSGSLQV